jgi:hypothetical protein
MAVIPSIDESQLQALCEVLGYFIWADGFRNW